MWTNSTFTRKIGLTSTCCRSCFLPESLRPSLRLASSARRRNEDGLPKRQCNVLWIGLRPSPQLPKIEMLWLQIILKTWWEEQCQWFGFLNQWFSSRVWCYQTPPASPLAISPFPVCPHHPRAYIKSAIGYCEKKGNERLVKNLSCIYALNIP